MNRTDFNKKNASFCVPPFTYRPVYFKYVLNIYIYISYMLYVICTRESDLRFEAAAPRRFFGGRIRAICIQMFV